MHTGGRRLLLRVVHDSTPPRAQAGEIRTLIQVCHSRYCQYEFYSPRMQSRELPRHVRVSLHFRRRACALHVAFESQVYYSCLYNSRGRRV